MLMISPLTRIVLSDPAVTNVPIEAYNRVDAPESIGSTSATDAGA